MSRNSKIMRFKSWEVISLNTISINNIYLNKMKNKNGKGSLDIFSMDQPVFYDCSKNDNFMVKIQTEP